MKSACLCLILVLAITGFSYAILPARSMLLPNYPNPFPLNHFNPKPYTRIPYLLAADASITIRIYNTEGQLIRTLHLGLKKAGYYIKQAAQWDGRDTLGKKVASGVYYYHFESGEFRATRKMVVK